jgi:subtilisin family serine protease
VARLRPGLGPRIDPLYDAEFGRTFADLSPGQSRTLHTSGYIELFTQTAQQSAPARTAYEQLQALMAVVHRQPKRAFPDMGLFGIADAPHVWAQVKRLRYLTTDPDTGIALPLHSLNPTTTGQTPLDPSELNTHLAQLERLTGGRLAQARMIGLTVDFDFTVEAGKLQTVLTQTAGEIEAGPVPEKHRVMLDQVMFGGWRRPFGAAQAPFDFQDVALSGGMSAQIKSAMRELRDGNNFSITPVPSLDYGIEETGKNVIIGVVDFGCDFAHPSFCSEDRKQSRILKLWDQNDDPEFPLGPTIVTPKPPSVAIAGEPCAFGFGRVFEKSDIDRVLEEWQENHANEADWPYQALGYDPHHHYYVPKKQGDPATVGAHGTCVLDVAASRHRRWSPHFTGDDNPIVMGVAPQSDIVFVQVRTREQRDGRRVLDPNDVVDGVAYIFHVAAEKGLPCVVNLSLNTMSGPHDGDGHFERRLSNLLRSNGAGKKAKGRAVVVAAGNLPNNNAAWRTWQHLADRVNPGQPFEFLWKFLDQSDVTRNSLEIWYEADAAWLQVSLNHPSAGHIATVSPGYAAELFCNGTLIGSIVGSRVRPTIQDSADLKPSADLKLPGSDNVPGRHVIYLSLDPHATATGSWKISLTLVDAANQPIGAARNPIAFNVWLERDDIGQTGIARREGALFIDPPDRNVCIGTLSCGADPVVVAAYDASKSAVGMWNYSASGPTALESKKPDISAPGADVWVILSKQETMRRSQSGTSIAAPFVTGTIACMFEAAPAAELETIRAALRDSARGGSAGGPQSGWSPQLGWGRLNPKEAVRLVRATSSTPSGGITEDHVARRLP